MGMMIDLLHKSARRMQYVQRKNLLDALEYKIMPMVAGITGADSRAVLLVHELIAEINDHGA